MSYPPAGAQHPATLGAPPVARVRYINRSDEGNHATTVRNHRAYHSCVDTLAELWHLLSDAASAASQATTELEQRELAARRALPLARQSQLNRKSRVVADHDRAHAHLWDRLDPSLQNKSAAVKSVAQAINLRLLCTGQTAESNLRPRDVPSVLERLGPQLCDWLELAHVVAQGMHHLFLAGIEEWDVGLNERHEVRTELTIDRDANGHCKRRAVEPRDAWTPFETYDRTADARYANCFGESDAQRFRSRVSIDKSRLSADAKAVARTRWCDAEDAHARMLEREATHALFSPGDAACRLTAAEIGGLFLLTNLPDNWAKRTDMFDLDFWKLRVVHYGIERNSGLRINNFSLQPLRQHDTDDTDDPPICPLIRQSSPDPKRSYCWLDNALHTMVALKVLIFLRLRTHAYDRFEGCEPTSEASFALMVRVDRHDIEQSKNHWLPSTRASAASIAIANIVVDAKQQKRTQPQGLAQEQEPVPPAPVVRGTNRDRKRPLAEINAEASPPPTPPKRRTNAIEQVRTNTNARWQTAGTVQLGVALGMMSSERFQLRHRIDWLDRVVGLHCAMRRLRRVEAARLEEEALQRITSLDQRLNAKGIDERKRAVLLNQQALILAEFDMTNVQVLVAQRLRRVAATEGLLWRAEDRLWATDHPTIATLRELDVGARLEDVVVRVPWNDWEDLFGSTLDGGLCGPTARCDPATGWARREAESLAKRLLALLQCEVAYREVESLDAVVVLPVECRPQLSLAAASVRSVPTGLPEHLRLYAQLVREENERKRQFETFVETMRRNMAHAIQSCFSCCLADASSEELDLLSSPKSPESLRMPDRLCGGRRRVAVDIVHKFLNVAKAFGGLIIAENELDTVEGTPILVYHQRTARLSMPLPEAVVEHHWQAAQLLLDLAVCAESWVRDHRRRPDARLTLTRLQRWITIDAEEGPFVHGHVRETAALANLNEDAAERTARYCPSWPPREHALSTQRRIATVLLWGGHAACTALANVKRAERATVPPRPYHNHNHTFVSSPAPIGEHVWMHRAHRDTLAAAMVCDDEIDEHDLFGETGPSLYAHEPQGKKRASRRAPTCGL